MIEPLIVLGGSWVVISGAISKVTIVIIHIRGLITPFITPHEPPSSPYRPPLKGPFQAMPATMGCSSWAAPWRWRSGSPKGAKKTGPYKNRIGCL